MKEDKTKEEHLKFFGLPDIFPFFKPHKKLMLTIIGTMILASAIDAILPLFQDYAITNFIGKNDLSRLPVFIVVYVVLMALLALINGVGAYSAFVGEVRMDRDVRRACFDHVQNLSFSYFNQNSVGYIHSRVISDPNRVGVIISWVLMDLINDTFYIITIFIIMFTLNAKLGLLLLILVPVMSAVTAFFQKHLIRENRTVREQNSIITGKFNEGITGAKTIKSLVIEDKMHGDFQTETGKMLHASVRAGRYKGAFRSSIIFLSGIATALVLWKGGKLTAENAMRVGALGVFMNYASSMGMYVQDLVDTISFLITSQVNIERIMKLLRTKSDVVDTPEVIEKYGDSFEPKKENWEDLYGDVEFKDVTFRYPDGDENVLEHFDLKVNKGQMVAIVGETGAGKSTLVNLVCRFFEPTDGQVLIDGRDARERSQLWLHSHIGYVLQTPHLFSGTVLENLKYGNPDATMEQIEEAVKRVSADRVISRMENGYDSQVGEGGDLLSTGEKQLVSFARALLADPRILVLDEATSSVDTLTEQAIKDAISTVTAGRTSFVIAHRLSTIRNADIILVMRDGKIVERGTHDSLLAEKGYYYRLYTQQFVNESSVNALGGVREHKYTKRR